MKITIDSSIHYDTIVVKKYPSGEILVQIPASKQRNETIYDWVDKLVKTITLE
jgi:hypothetical protein